MKVIAIGIMFLIVSGISLGLFLKSLSAAVVPDKKQVICIDGYKFLNGSLCGPVQVLNGMGGGVRCDP